MPSSTELRQDPSTRDWVVIAPGRSQRPHGRHDRERLEQSAAGCPFCPGHELETPGEVWRIPAEDGTWRVRVVPNRFPTLTGDGAPSRTTTPAGFVAMPGVGVHEVIIESANHTADLACADDSAVRDVLGAYRARYRALTDHAEVVIIFRNHGPAAGTSLAHPHSQIIAMPVVPIQVRHRFEVAMQHYDDLGTCLYLDILNRELLDGRRIVLQTDRYVAFQPFAATVPFETWIMPRVLEPSFGETSDASLDALSPVLRKVLASLAEALDDPDYNYVFQSAPIGDEDRPYFVWHVRIIPRLLTTAGFELGSGMAVNPSLPEETAARLRNAIVG